LFPKAKYNRHVLFLKPRDPEAERWTAARPAQPALKEKYGVDRSGGATAVTAARCRSGARLLAILAPVSDLKDERTECWQ